MHFLFIDESGSPPPPAKAAETPFFVLGGVVIPEDVWTRLNTNLSRIKKKFAVRGEIKWRYFAPQKFGGKAHSLSHLDDSQKEELRSALYAALTSYKSVRLICVVCDTASAYRFNYVNNADDLYWYCYKQITERFQYYLQDLERAVGQKLHGIIVCDHRAPKDDERLRELHHKLMTSQEWHTSAYDRIIEGVFIAPSHLSVGIQFADMVAGAVYRYYSASDKRFIGQIEGAFRQSPTGKVEGYGLVFFPRKKEK